MSRETIERIKCNFCRLQIGSNASTVTILTVLHDTLSGSLAGKGKKLDMCRECRESWREWIESRVDWGKEQQAKTEGGATVTLTTTGTEGVLTEEMVGGT